MIRDLWVFLWNLWDVDPLDLALEHWRITLGVLAASCVVHLTGRIRRRLRKWAS